LNQPHYFLSQAFTASFFSSKLFSKIKINLNSQKILFERELHGV